MLEATQVELDKRMNPENPIGVDDIDTGIIKVQGNAIQILEKINYSYKAAKSTSPDEHLYLLDMEPFKIRFHANDIVGNIGPMHYDKPFSARVREGSIQLKLGVALENQLLRTR